MDHGFKLVQLAPQPALAIREKLSFAEIPGKMPGIFDEIYRSITKHNITIVGAPFAFYHSWDDKETEMEVGFPVAPGSAGEGRIRPTTLPGGRVVTGTHIGPYDKLVDSYNAMTAWMKERGYEPAKSMWETYMTDPDVEKDQAKHVTEMFWPVA